MTPSLSRRLALLCTLLFALPSCRQVARYAAASDGPQVPDAHFVDVQIADSARADQLQPLDAHLPDDLGRDVALEGGPDLPCLDTDGDGVCSNVDCRDDDPNSYPGAPEICDGVDNDCDSVVDEGCCTTCIDKTGKCVTAISNTECGSKGQSCENCKSVGKSCSAAGACYAP